MVEKAVVKIVNVSEWIKQNEEFFTPPVCNKMMHGDGQIDVMFVGGPNCRKDYHIEGGEELFLQVKGDMVLKVMERGQHKYISIKEGEIFLLPRAIPHSPQRFAETVGLVLERRRHDKESDGLRYFTEVDGIPQADILYEVWFSWRKESMPALFDQFHNSEEYKTGRPSSKSVCKSPPITVDSETKLKDPFNLKDWIEKHRQEIDDKGKVALFDVSKHQMQVYIYGKGVSGDINGNAETWIWQLNGNSLLKCQNKEFNMKQDDSALIPVNEKFILQQEEGSLALVCYQDPTKSAYYPKD